MKKILLCLTMAFCFLQMPAQVTLTLQPDACSGKDAFVFDNDPNYAGGTLPVFAADRWTCGGNPCHGVSVIGFNLSSIPQGATIVSANLSLYANTNNVGTGSLGNPTYGTNNAGYLKRITSAWNENTVTWNTLPSSTATDQVLLPQSSSTTQDYLSNDITTIAQYWVQNPAQNYGLLLDLITTNSLNSLIFCSSDYSDSTKHPQLVITYIPPQSGCITLQPDACSGKDAFVFDNDPNYAGGTLPVFAADRWTCGGNPCHGVSVIGFNLSSIPQGATIVSANLSLSANTNNVGTGSLGNPTYGTNNAGYLKRITSAWNENTVTWNTLPSSTATDQVLLPQSSSTTQDYLSNDITTIAQYWVQNPAQNYGLLLDLITTNSLNSLIFCSSDYSDSTRHPKLEVCFSIPTSIAEINSSIDIKVYPNPATYQLTINLGGLQAEQVSIYSVDGKLVSEAKQPVNNRIDISSLATGVYIAEVKVKDVMQRVRWVKM